MSFVRYDKNTSGILYRIQINDKWGYANGEDSIVIKPVYDYAYSFKNGIAKVARDNQWGYIDTNNDQIIPLVYDSIMSQGNDVIRVCKEGKWGLINFQNEEITPMKYDEIHPFEFRTFITSPFLGLARVYIDGKIGYINQQGVEVIPVEYDEIVSYSRYWTGKSKYYRTRSGEKYGYISDNGVLCKPIFDEAGERLYYNGFSPKNKTLADEIGKYSEVIYEGKPYLFTEKGMLYKYKKQGFFKEKRLKVDFDSGIYVGE